MFFRALLSHRILFTAAAVHWGAGVWAIGDLGRYAYVILSAAVALTILAGQRAMAAQQHRDAEMSRDVHAMEFMAGHEVTQEMSRFVIDVAEKILSQQDPRHSGAHRVLRVVEDHRSEPAG